MKIKNISETAPQAVYAIQTSTHTFIADNLAHHNCVHCNKFLHGNLNVYAERLIEKYGPDIIGELNRLGKCVIKFDREDLGKLINVLSEAVERLP